MGFGVRFRIVLAGPVVEISWLVFPESVLRTKSVLVDPQIVATRTKVCLTKGGLKIVLFVWILDVCLEFKDFVEGIWGVFGEFRGSCPKKPLLRNPP